MLYYNGIAILMIIINLRSFVPGGTGIDIETMHRTQNNTTIK